MTTAISILTRLCRPGSDPVVPRWLWDAAWADFIATPPTEELETAFISIMLAKPKLAQERAA